MSPATPPPFFPMISFLAVPLSERKSTGPTPLLSLIPVRSFEPPPFRECAYSLGAGSDTSSTPPGTRTPSKSLPPPLVGDEHKAFRPLPRKSGPISNRSNRLLPLSYQFPPAVGLETLSKLCFPPPPDLKLFLPYFALTSRKVPPTPLPVSIGSPPVSFFLGIKKKSRTRQEKELKGLPLVFYFSLGHSSRRAQFQSLPSGFYLLG